MKKYFCSALFFLLGISLFAQAPQGINFQAVARKSDGNPMGNSSVNVTFKIRQSSPIGNPIFEETHPNVPTDNCGMFRLTIGAVDPTNVFDEIPWASGFKWLEVLVNGISVGNLEMLSVPYALYAEKSGDGGTAYTAGQGINIGNNVISASDDSPNNEIQTLSVSGNQVSLSNGGGTVNLPPDTDAQVLSVSGNQLTISNGNMVTLPNTTYQAETGLTLNGNVFQAQNTNAIWNANQLQGFPVVSTTPLPGQILMWNGEVWIPMNNPVQQAQDQTKTLIYAADGF